MKSKYFGTADPHTGNVKTLIKKDCEKIKKYGKSV